MSASVIEVSSGSIIFKCPGCRLYHELRIRTDPPQAPSWEWNGSLDKPVITPSILARGSDWENRTCHSFVGCNGAQPGEIRFLADSTHALAGQTVPLPPYPPEKNGEDLQD